MNATPSPLDAALARVGDRWSLLVVEALLGGPQRFNDLLAAVPGVATNVLSQRLKRLESESVVIARPYSERPPRFSYELTAAGTELAGGPPPPGQLGRHRRRRPPPHRLRHPPGDPLALPHLRPPRVSA